MNKERIPEAVIRRLPKYFRYLKEMEERGAVRVSSSKMSRDLASTPPRSGAISTASAALGSRGMATAFPSCARKLPASWA